MLFDIQENITELEMFCMALQDTDRGLFLFRSEAQEQLSVINELEKHIVYKTISSRNATSISFKDQRIQISFFEEWIEEQPDVNIFILYNLQNIPQSNDEISFCNAFNYLRDELIDLNRIIIFGMSPYFSTALSRYASDLYSFFNYHANFINISVNSDYIDDKALIYPGDVKQARERVLEMHRQILDKGIEVYDNSMVSLNFFMNFLKSWHEVSNYMSEYYITFIKDVLAKTIRIINVLNEVTQINIANLIRYDYIIGSVYLELNEYQEALYWYQKTLGLSEKTVGNDHMISTIYGDIAKVYFYTGKYQEALMWYQKELDVTIKNSEENHLNTAIVYNNIATIHISLGKYQEAETWCLKALEVFEKELGNDHLDTVEIKNNLGVIYRHMGKYDEAILWYFNALNVIQKVVGNNHPTTASVINNIAAVFDYIGMYDMALKLYRKALDIYLSIFGENHPSTLVAFGNIAYVYKNTDNYKEALLWYRYTLKIYGNTMDKDHPNVANVYNNIAITYYKMKDYYKSLIWNLKALKIRDEKLNKHHPDTGTSYNNVSYIYEALGDYEEAQRWCRKALEVYENAAGKDHPNTKSISHHCQELCTLMKKNHAI